MEDDTLKQSTNSNEGIEKDRFAQHHLTIHQVIFITILLTFIISIATTLSIIYYFSDLLELSGGPAFIQTVLPVRERTTREINEKILRQDELVVGVVKEASPSVVSIIASKDVPLVEQYYVNPFPDDPFFGEFFR